MHHIVNQTRRLSSFNTLKNVTKHVEKSTTNYQSFEPIIGLEVHAQLNIISKLFSRGRNSSQASPNTQLDLLDVSIPGTLPTLNIDAVRAAITTALGLNCTIQDVIHFDRKNYFYADMPAGFQITQYLNPIAKDGYLEFIVTTYHDSLVAYNRHYDIAKNLHRPESLSSDEMKPYIKRSQIKQIQLEQDSAKTLCDNEDGQGFEGLIDYNRSGCALIELVFEPDLRNPHEASSLVTELIRLLKTLKTCDCELQQGSLRVDANISIKSIDGQHLPQELAARVELKNLNSVRALNKGLSYEISRQVEQLRLGKAVVQESRTYNSKSGRTVLLRAKESAIDYRYVPEPSIPQLTIKNSLKDALKIDSSQVVLPSKWRDILKTEYDLELILIAQLLNEPGLVEYYLDIMSTRDKTQSSIVAEFLIYSLINLNKLAVPPAQVDLEDAKGYFLKRLKPHVMNQLFDMILNDEIGYAVAYRVIKCIFTNELPTNEPRKLVEQLDSFQINDEKTIEVYCDDIIRGMKNISKQYKKRGDQRYMRMMLEKLSELYHDRVNIRLAIKYLNSRLRNEN